jgi:hypothetical protein
MFPESLNDRLTCLLSNQTQAKANAFSQHETVPVEIVPALSIWANSNWRMEYGDRQANIRNSLVSQIS